MTSGLSVVFIRASHWFHWDAQGSGGRGDSTGTIGLRC